jgi:hypothetical protein
MYAVVRIKVTDIEANSQIEAIEKAEPVAMDFATEYLNGAVRRFDHVTDYEFAEGFSYALVDEHGDEDYENSRWYEPSQFGGTVWKVSNG